ncbi:hypothetical protein RUM43_000358 [Polyplax serrata]|uniref:Uncharacterized protein n=1 Tax=Polyplax serrata TaxID=468196 RepID=A0AAN8SFP0_POLSC
MESNGKPGTRGKSEDLPTSTGDSSRFHVAKVNNANENGSGPDTRITIPNIEIDKCEGPNENGDKNSSTPSPNIGRLSENNTYVYDPKLAKNLYEITREALPRLEHYKDSNSVHHAQRPSLDALHNDDFYEKVQKEKEEENIELQGKIIKFGWLDGVFMRCLLNIWGVMLFLRLSWVVGQAGIGEGILIICLSNVVTLVTTISMSAVCTNGQIKGGGVYYMISRSLGPQFGGAIGLMFTLANSVAVAMYIVGFCESLQTLLKSFDLIIIDGDTNDIRLVGVITLVLILVLAIVGMDWVTRTQMVLLIVLVCSQIDFMIGTLVGPKNEEEIARGFVGYNSEVFTDNFFSQYRYYEGTEHDFFSVFAVFFPAVTGIVAGANLSGDLKDPSSAIPKGTLLAILVTFLSYLTYAFMIGGCTLRDATGSVDDYLKGLQLNASNPMVFVTNCTEGACEYGLQNDSQAMELTSLWGPLIYGGCFAATLSSAIASLVGAPRVLQALAKDKLYPFIGFFSKGYGANNDPVRGYVLVFLTSFACILIAQLNAIAPLLSNFFLTAYALINFSVFHASISKSPGWRPAFRYYNAWVSLLGTLLCIVVMFLISWWTALITFVVVITLYLYVSYRKPDVNWGSSTQAQCYSMALRSVIDLNDMEEHVKNYRPQIIIMSGLPGWRPPLVHFANLLVKGLSLLICSHVVPEETQQREIDALTKRGHRWLAHHKVKGFFNVVGAKDFEAGARSLMQSVGIGKLKPNMLLMGYKSEWKKCDQEDLLKYFNVIHAALDKHLAIGIFRMPTGLDYSKKIQDDDLIAPENERERKRRKRNKKVLSRNDSADQLSSDSETETKKISSSPVGETLKKKNQTALRSRFKGNIVPRVERTPLDLEGNPVPQDVVDSLMHFKRKQATGYIDVWWLYDDGGLTLLLPYILSTRSIFAECKLRVFSLCSNADELDQEQRKLAALLSKFRISCKDVIVIPDIMKKAQVSSKIEFDAIIQDFRVPDNQVTEENKAMVISDSEYNALKEKSNRHMRLRELLKEHSSDSTFIVMTLPVPRKGSISAPMYMAWLELLTKGMPPYLLVRGNQKSVLTFYS